MRNDLYPLNVPAGADGTGSIQATPDMVDKWVQVGGTFTCTVTLQGTIDGNNWVTLLATAVAGIFEVPHNVRSMRVVISGWAAGQATVMLAARCARSE